MELFGFQIKRKEPEKDSKGNKSFVVPMEDDGAATISTGAGSYFGQYIDVDGAFGAKSDSDLIRRYRDIAAQPECDAAIEDIVNEAIVSNADSAPIDIKVDDLDQPETIKNQIREEFKNIVALLQFNNYGHDIFRKWYIDGKLYYHIIVDEKNPKRGIKELRPIDSARIKKVKEVSNTKDPITGANLIESVKEYYVYQDSNLSRTSQGLKISSDAISFTTSGLLDPSRKNILSYLQKAIKPVNQLRMMEDSLVIYRLSRAPERRIFYIDVGNLPKGKAEEYLKSVMANYRNKLVYDANTGEVKDDRKHMSLLEDFWLPRREGGRGTEITTLPGGENLGQIEDIIYFQKKLYRSLNVPVARLEQESQFSLGRSTEISRDEVKFQKFIDRLRKKFSWLFLDLLKTQLLIKGIITEQDWRGFKEDISVDFIRDSHFSELKNNEILRERIEMLSQVDQYIGVYFSRDWVRKNILNFADSDIKQMADEITKEGPIEEYDEKEDVKD